MTTPYNLTNIRRLLTEDFTLANLRSFCYDHSDFRPAYKQLAENTVW